MGRIKSTLVKRTANNLLKEDNQFSEDFEKNKKLLGRTMPSKKVRNKIAGYISRLKKQEKKEK
jgi:ribosomal protein S17E